MASNSISTLNVKLTADGRALLSEFQKSQQAIKTWAKDVQGIKNSLGTLISADLIAGGIRTISAEFKQFVGDSLKAAADLQVYQLQFETIFQSAEKAKKVIQEIYDFGDKTPFQSGDLIAASKQLAGYQIVAEDILPTLQTLGDIAAVSGASLGDLSQIYGRIVGDGRAMNEDLNRLADRSIPIYSELAKVIGVSTAEVRKLASAGQITSQQVQQALVNMTTGAGQFSGAIEKLAGTSAGQFSTLLDSIEAIKRSFGEGLLPQAQDFAAILTEIVSGGQQGADAMNAWREAGEALGKTLRGIAGVLQVIRANLVALEGGIATIANLSFKASPAGAIDRATGGSVSSFNDAFLKDLKKQYDDLRASAGRILNFDQPMVAPKVGGGQRQAGIESIIQPTQPQAAINDIKDQADSAARAMGGAAMNASDLKTAIGKLIDSFQVPTSSRLGAPDRQSNGQDNSTNDLKAAIGNLIESTRTPAITQPESSIDFAKASEAAVALAAQSQKFAETAITQIEAAKAYFRDIFKGAGTDGATSSPITKSAPVDVAKMIGDDIRAVVDKARAELMAIDRYLGRSETPSPQRIAERVGTINFGDYQRGKYGSLGSIDYFKAQGGELSKLIESLQGTGGVSSKSTIEKSAESTTKASDQTARNVEKMENRLVSEMGKDRGLLARIAAALERKNQNQNQIQVKVYGV